ncbi:hypothetical protein Hypma_010962 [Hypsizygus marmoreus]|uniref:DH domain-containing protein n=1 Tax=Hypsizygus marmoreus TaxID=39966 RepID=A0A369JND4_HYPMA|nr:hypothetical protein Hypma_010962 [Hypsizygus marmoreus]
MPLARTNTARTKSRSPAPPSNSRALSNPRAFLPPSHYAAAAGVTYSPRSPTHSEDNHSYDLNYSRGLRNDSIDSREPYGPSFIPVTYASEVESTDSSFDSKPTSGVRFSSLDKEKQSLSSKPSIRAKRHSVITGLPQLETHLLPSLRDTIDRMTRSPTTRAGSSSSPRNGSHLELRSSSNSAWSSRPPSPSDASPTSHFDDSATTPENTSSRAYHSENPENPPYDIPSGSATPVEALTPRTNLPMMKSALKSALRPPTPKLFSRTPPSTEDSPLSIGGVTLKSVRSILRRKTSTSSAAAVPTPVSGSSQKMTSKSSKALVPPIVTSTRSRSRADPGTSTASERRSSPEGRIAATQSTEKETQEIHHSPYTMSIPRLQGKTPKGAWSQTSLTDESDLEYRYEMEGRDRRKLVVANAEVVPSSSESEAERRGRTRGQRLEREYRSPLKPLRDGTALVGLGFDFDDENTRKNRAGTAREVTNIRNQDSPRSTSRTWAPDSRSLPTRSNRPAGFRSPHESKPTRSPAPSSRPMDELDAEHRRRRAALLGIVSRLDLGAPSTYISGETEESEYCGEDGFAISGSGDFVAETHEHYSPPSPRRAGKDQDEDYTEEDYEQAQEVQQSVRFRTERPRSSSCMPTFVLSTDDNENPSSYSAHRCQRHAESRIPSPHVDMGRKSHSRSPIVRQKDAHALPNAPRRHSGNRPPSLHTRSNILEDRNPTTKRPSSSENRESFQRRRASSNVDPSGSYPAAARERQAYGIPSSDSVEVYQRTNRLERSLPHAESDLSSVSSVYWDEECDSSELSVGAETLFRKLSGGPAKEAEWRSHQGMEKSPRLNTVSRAPNPSIGYEDQVIDKSWQQRATSPSRQGNRPRPPRPPSKSPDPQDPQLSDLEQKRQDLIVEICQTEETFVRRLQVFVRLFILPLRVQDSKTWISGVPSEVARLFDWLEDIVVLHRQLLSSLKTARSSQYPLVERIAESMRTFIPRLEVYQPYLVKLVDVTGLINQLVQDENNDFGEFVEMQEGAPECDGWSIERFLVEPVNRLAKLPEFFSRLLELTAKSHPDYLSTLSLLHSADMVIRVMTEVKAREDEYELIKKFSTCVQGLPSSVQLATRERRLLQQGTLLLVDVDDKKSESRPNTPELSNIARYFPQGAKRDDVRAVNQTSRLANTMDDTQRKRSESESASSSSAGMSYRSYGSSSSGASSNAPSTPSSTGFSSSRIPMPDRRTDKARHPSSKVTSSARPDPRTTARHPSRGTLIQAFVFSDLVLFAIPASSSSRTPGEPDSEQWTLLKHIGIVRILGIQNSAPVDKTIYESGSITMDVLPVDVNKLEHVTPVDDDGSVIILHLAVPRQDISPHSLPRSGRPSPAVDDLLETRQSWISAFQRCFRFTLCSISGPSSARNQDPQQFDLEKDTHKTIFSLLASGLPLPKSPSGQVAALREGERADARNLEREERGWWSLRFQQVFRELQRQDITLSLN